MLANSGVAPHRTQPWPRVCTGIITEFPPERLGCLQRPHSQEQRPRGRSAQGLRLRHGCVGQVAQTHQPSRPEPVGPFENWPTNLGFESFYGFLAGESSQLKTNLVRNTTFVSPPKTPEEGYHLNEDLADDAINWLHKHQAMAPDRPFFMYWASDRCAGPHHDPKEYIDKYQGKFDDGWDAYRGEGVRAGQGEGLESHTKTQLTPRHEQMASWESVPESERPFQSRLMEVCAAYGEHADVRQGVIVDEIEALGYGDNTLIFYLWGDEQNVGAGSGRHDQRAGGAQRHRHDH